ncbi:MFS transporter [Clostridium botulinum]|uniref:MFS transporter n=1 Tax=Clostridium botulinum TaxID=1491 RepID=A0A6B4JTW4_CLOBO|nr:MFS transporter [Clostridium botulinum]NFD85589.1 MFS transporter [Clostridium botulinum]NFE09539.1 MFS transporter [Clostridium botulinum]NFE35813.1 MFS transporter [Clostridium botulinum]NFE48638.1 MFS transporter [Clostridium botulinum]
MKRVDKYIDLIYKNVEGNKEEINIMKQEMKSHIVQSVIELQQEGKSEEESINIAINRFGEVNQIKDELREIYSFHKRFSKNILIVALVVLFIGTASLITKSFGNKLTEMTMDSVSNAIRQSDEIPKDKIRKLFEKNKRILKYDNKNLKYIAVFKYPKDYKLELDRDIEKLEEAKYTYPSMEDLNKELKRIGYIANAGEQGGLISDKNNNKYSIRIGYIAPNSQWVINNLPNIFIIGCFVTYWILFGVWATVKAYRTNGYNLAWSISFFIFNIFAYILFKLKNGRKVANLIINTIV